MADVYIVLDGARVVGVSARSQGAELIRADRAGEIVDSSRRYSRTRRIILDRLHELRGHDLVCWCPLDSPCHADVLLELADA